MTAKKKLIITDFHLTLRPITIQAIIIIQTIEMTEETVIILMAILDQTILVIFQDILCQKILRLYWL